MSSSKPTSLPLRSGITLALILLLTGISANSQTGWNEVRSNIVNPYGQSIIYALAKDAAGNIYAGIGSGVFKWNGNSWVELGALKAAYSIQSIVADQSGNVYAGGWFENSAGKYYVAKWNGSNWSELGTGSAALNANGAIQSLAIDPSGNIYAAGEFTNGVARQYVAKWNGSAWSELKTATSTFNVIGTIWSVVTDATGNVYAAGNFKNTDDKRYVVKWDGNSWTELGIGSNGLNANGNILCLATDNAGNVYASGQFVNSLLKHYVAKWNGSSWTELGFGSNALYANSWILCLTTDAAGNIYAAGDFSNSVGKYVSKWDGTKWQEVGRTAQWLNANGAIHDLIADAAGNLFAAGEFTNNTGYKRVVKWDISAETWDELDSRGNGILDIQNNFVTSVITDVSGNVYAIGAFLNGNSRRYVARWKDNRWAELASKTSALNANANIHCIATDPAGNIYAAGSFTNGGSEFSGSNYVAKWDGNSWTELGTGSNALNAPNQPITCLGTDAAGNVYAAGYLKNAQDKYYIAKWNGTTWSELGGGTNLVKTLQPVSAMHVDAAGNVYVGSRLFNPNGYEYHIDKWNGTTWNELSLPGELLNTDEPVQSITTDNNGNVYATAVYLDLSSGWHAYIAKWNGSTWRRLGQRNFFTGPAFLTSDAAGNIYAASGLEIFKWNGTHFIPLGELAYRQSITTLAVDNAGNIYGAGTFPEEQRTFGVAKFDPLFLPVPRILNVDNICVPAVNAKGKLVNPPFNGTLTVTQDGTPLTYTAADSSFTFFQNGVTTNGSHKITVTYSNTANTTKKDSTYTVAATVTPTITITGNTRVVIGRETVLTSNYTHGGPTPVLQWLDSTATHYWAAIPGQTGNTLTYLPATGNKVRCDFISNATCATVTNLSSNTLLFDVITAIDPVPGARETVRLQGNPARNVIVIDRLKLTDKWQTLAVIGIDGKVVKSGINISGRTMVTIDVHALPGGLYTCLLRTKQGSGLLLKFVKQ